MADFGYDISDYRAIDPLFGDMADFDALLREAHALRAEAAARLRAQSHLRPAPVVRREPLRPRQPQARLVHLEGPGARRRAAEQLDQQFRRLGLDTSTRRRGQYYYHAFLEQQPDLNWRNPGRAPGDVRRAALLARQGGRRLSGRRDLAPGQGPAVPRQSAQPGVGAGPARNPALPAEVLGRPAGRAWLHRGAARR